MKHMKRYPDDTLEIYSSGSCSQRARTPAVGGRCPAGKEGQRQPDGGSGRGSAQAHSFEG